MKEKRVDRAGVSAPVVEVTEARNSHDMRRFSACFAVDADFVNVGGAWWRGRDEIERRHVAAHAGPFAHSVLRATARAVRGARRR